MLSPGRGLRGDGIRVDLVRQTPEGAVANGWALSADVRDGEVRPPKLSLSLELDEQGKSKRTARLDGVEIRHAGRSWRVDARDLADAVDGPRLRGAAGDRRKFLDRQVLAHFPSHAAAPPRVL